MRSTRVAAAIAVALLAFSIAGCGSDEGVVPPPPTGAEETQDIAEPPRGPATTVADSCDIGAEPDHYVPGEPSVTIGCAQLGISGRTVPISVAPERIDRESYFCLNPAYDGRGQPGIYIPAVCPKSDSVDEARVLDDRVPTQGVQRYERVVWGLAPAGFEEAVVSSDEGEPSAAAVFAVNRGLADRAGLSSPPFNVFMGEIPAGSECEEVVLTLGVGRQTSITCPPSR